MASIDDIATIQKNGVVAVNTLNQTILRIFGTNTTPTANVSTFVIKGAGRVVNVSVTVAGTTAGAIHNCPSVGDALTTNMLAVVTNTVGVYPLNLLFTNGLTLIVGTGQEFNVTYSAGT